MAERGWERPFENPNEVAGRKLVTLRGRLTMRGSSSSAILLSFLAVKVGQMKLQFGTAKSPLRHR